MNFALSREVVNLESGVTIGTYYTEKAVTATRRAFADAMGIGYAEHELPDLVPAPIYGQSTVTTGHFCALLD